jgi:Flp pilus assembly protein TadG
MLIHEENAVMPGTLKRALGRFRRNIDATVAIVFALAAVPILTMVGVSIDYAMAARDRAALQEAFDAAALAGSKATVRGEAAARQEAIDLVAANLPSRLRNIAPEITINGATMTVRTAAPHLTQTGLLRVIGVSDIGVTAASVATAAVSDLDVALVLDNTGSMAGQKITELKAATRAMLQDLQAMANPMVRVRVGIVPFDTQVRIQTAAISPAHVDFAALPVGARPPTPVAWPGCVADREQPNDTRDVAPFAGNVQTLYPASQTCGLAPIMPLTSDWTQLNSHVDLMRASGNTNLTIGVVWGMHVLSPGEPLIEGAGVRPNRTLVRAMVVLTDGDNTQNRWTYSRSAIDARARQACTNARDAGLRVYTIRVLNGSEQLLRDCASAPELYYNITNASQLTGVFRSIASDLGQLRISR